MIAWPIIRAICHLFFFFFFKAYQLISKIIDRLISHSLSRLLPKKDERTILWIFIIERSRKEETGLNEFNAASVSLISDPPDFMHVTPACWSLRSRRACWDGRLITLCVAWSLSPSTLLNPLPFLSSAPTQSTWSTSTWDTCVREELA